MFIYIGIYLLFHIELVPLNSFIIVYVIPNIFSGILLWSVITFMFFLSYIIYNVYTFQVC